MTPFDFINAINHKTPIEWTEEVEKDYAPFMINRGLGYFPESVQIANELNKLSHIDKKMQFDLLYALVPRGKRFTKWNKADNNPDVILLTNVFGYSRQYASTVIDLFTQEQLEELRMRIDTGGR
jgi:hypothetical protein